MLERRSETRAIARTVTPSKTASQTRNSIVTDTVQKVIDGIIYSIRSGQMVPGQHLVEADLTRRFGVSRGSLREGLKQLASEGMVTLTPYRGAFIAALDRKGVRDLLDVLEPLCSLAAARAAEGSADAGQHRRLIAVAEELSDPDEALDRAHYLEKRHQFYDLLIEMGGNSELRRVIPLARADLFRAQFDRVQTRAQHRRHADGHLRIARAVTERDPKKARHAVTAHFDGTRQTVDDLSDSAFSGPAR